MSDFEIWIYRALVSILVIVIGWYLQKLVLKIDELICTIQELAKNDVKQAAQIDNINDRLRVTDGRLNDHSQRIRTIEINNKKILNG
jgi:hypothetical protein